MTPQEALKRVSGWAPVYYDWDGLAAVELRAVGLAVELRTVNREALRVLGDSLERLKAAEDRIAKHTETCRGLAEQLEDYRAARKRVEGQFGDVMDENGDPASLETMVEWLIDGC